MPLWTSLGAGTGERDITAFDTLDAGDLLVTSVWTVGLRGSTDYGGSWSDLACCTSPNPILALQPGHTFSDMINGGVLAGFSGLGCYRSTDGIAWSQVAGSSHQYSQFTQWTGGTKTGFPNNCIVAHFATGKDLWVSTNNGSTWVKAVTMAYTWNGVKDKMYMFNGYMHVGGGSWFQRSNNPGVGNTWRLLEHYTGSSPNDVNQSPGWGHSSPANPAYGLVRIDDASPFPGTIPPASTAVAVYGEFGGMLLSAHVSNGRLGRSSDGLSWRIFNPTGETHASWEDMVVFDNRVFVGGGGGGAGPWYSNRGGIIMSSENAHAGYLSSWDLEHFDGSGASSYPTIFGFQVHPQGNKLYAVDQGGTVWVRDKTATPPTPSDLRVDGVVQNPPSTFVNSKLPDFDWLYTDDEAEDSAEFEIEIATDPGFTSSLIFNKIGAQVVSTGNRMSYQYLNTDYELFSGITYYWRVKVKDSTGLWSGWVT